jgi:hypothetical protein
LSIGPGSERADRHEAHGAAQRSMRSGERTMTGVLPKGEDGIVKRRINNYHLLKKKMKAVRRVCRWPM